MKTLLKLVIPKELDAIPALTQEVEDALMAESPAPECALAAAVCMEECLVNSITHGKGTEIVMELYIDGDEFVMVFIDNGTDFNPISHEPSTIPLDAEDRLPGGMGITMLRDLMDSITYRRENNRNILALRKKLHP